MVKTDRIHPLGYLIAHEINLAHLEQDKNEIAILRGGSEVLSCSVEILEKSNQAGTIDIGTSEESDFFLNDIDLTQKANYKSKVETTLKDDTNLILETTAREGIIKIRLLYYTAGTIYS